MGEAERIVEPEVVSSETLAILNKSEIDIQIATARAYPRSIRAFQDEVFELACLNEQIASECTYAVPRAGQTIEGPSARFAEIVASAWGNCRAGARVVNEERDFIVTQGVFHDLQKNVAITYEVKRRITDKQGRRFSADMISTTSNAACSIALRNAVLKGVPKAVWADMWAAARRTAKGDVRTLNTRRADCLKLLSGYGITEEQVCKKMGVRGMDDIGIEELVTLRAIFNSIKEGEITPEEAFGEEKQAAKPTTMSDIKGKKKAAKAEPDDHGTSAGEESLPPEEEEPPHDWSDAQQAVIEFASKNLNMDVPKALAWIFSKKKKNLADCDQDICDDILEAMTFEADSRG